MPSDYSHDVAQICLEGHVVNSATQHRPQDSSKRCSQCGAETITKCPSCGKPIKGVSIYHRTARRFDPGMFINREEIIEDVGYTYPRPAHCEECGEAYPWTERKKSALLELAKIVLTDQKYDQFKNNIDDLIRETGRLPVAQLLISISLEGQSAATLHSFEKLMKDLIPEQSLDLIINVKK
jgi:hypothetical protein